MIIAGPCLFTDLSETDEILRTAVDLRNNIGSDVLFRCKLWGGGTTLAKWFDGVGADGVPILSQINDDILSSGTEIRTEYELMECNGAGLDFVWIGARNSANYSLYKSLELYRPKKIFIKRSPAMIIDEFHGLYDILTNKFNLDVYMIERGIVGFSNDSSSKFSPDLKGVIRIKNEYPEMFEKLVVDCSHSVFKKDYVSDVYEAFKSINIKHFMFECMSNPEKAKTDKNHMLSVEELSIILKNRSI